MKVLKWLDENFEAWCLTIFTSVMMVALFLQVLFRFVIKSDVAWVEEISLACMVWLTYFGCSLAIKRRAHLKVEIITTFLKPKARKIFDFISLIFFFAFACFVLYYSMMLTIDVFSRGQTTAVLEIPKWIIYMGVPLGFALNIIRMVQEFIRLGKEYKEIGDESIEA